MGSLQSTPTVQQEENEHKCIGGFQVYNKTLDLGTFTTKAKAVEKELVVMSSGHTR